MSDNRVGTPAFPARENSAQADADDIINDSDAIRDTSDVHDTTDVQDAGAVRTVTSGTTPTHVSGPPADVVGGRDISIGTLRGAEAGVGESIDGSTGPVGGKSAGITDTNNETSDRDFREER